MRCTTSSILALVAALPQAFAHYEFDRLIGPDGTITGRYEYVRKQNLGNGPFYDVSDNDIRCNSGSFATAADTKTLPVKAGDTVGFGINSVLGHEGPLMVYMSKSTATDITKYEGEGDWFKIYELGVKTYATYQTAATWLATNFKEFTFVIPKDIEDGQYLLRAEHMAIHSAGSAEGAQFYFECAQIEVTGGTGGKPSPVGKFPGIYTKDDAGINFNPYWPPLINYTIPGLKVFPEGGSFPEFTADPSGAPQTQPLPATATGGSGPAAIAPAATKSATVTTVPAPSSEFVTSVIEAQPSTTPAAITSAIEEPTSIAEVNVPTPAASSAAPPAAPSNDATLPEVFTLDQFIEWLRGTSGTA